MNGFLIRIEELRTKNNVSRSKMLKDLELNPNSIVNWMNRDCVPSGDVVAKIACYFNVTSDYLLTGTLSTQSETPLVRKDEERWKAIHDKVSALSEEDQDKLLDKLPKLIDLLTDQDQQGVR